MAQQTTLDLDRRDVLAAADDHVLDPVADLGVAVCRTTAASPVWNHPSRVAFWVASDRDSSRP